ncbi:hypothetical protein M408DRAFT_329996 [Serendipita vermifera MAFF 305830]|uniref:Uncharacterized protein n=1 Tax=Serendipita vermifera MAFF 305830 TaxID=933852 RepID=A0A0C3B7Z8_SERVB|nr:hypothetical protein M408DRAFT_329996 [Serendipita vermifera MAFF 305830]
MPVTVLISTFAPFGNFCINTDAESTISDLYEDLTLREPLLRKVGDLRLYPTAHPLAQSSTTLSDLCGDDQNIVSFRLTPSVLGGKGGFGSQLRAAGGRMSSQRTSNNDSCRDLSGRRLSTVKEAKKLAAYLESEPERKKAALEAQKAKLAALDKQLGNAPGGSKDSQVHAGTKRRLDDTGFLEESQTLVENVKSAVTQGLLLKRRKKAKMDPPPVPSANKEEQQLKTEAIATTAPEVTVA